MTPFYFSLYRGCEGEKKLSTQEAALQKQVFVTTYYQKNLLSERRSIFNGQMKKLQTHDNIFLKTYCQKLEIR